MAVAELVKIPGDLLSPLQTVTQAADAATMTVSGLDCQSRRYRFECALGHSGTVGNLTIALNGTNMTSQVCIESDASLGTVVGFTARIAFAVNHMKGSIKLWAKSGDYRVAISTLACYLDSGNKTLSYRGDAVWTDTAASVTSLTFTTSAGLITLGSTIQVFDDGPAQ